MPIAPLSESTARVISSTLVLNDATSVVKELLDNALDANARNITVEISSNTLDIIQVKDNGAGIGIEDRQVLCKRGLTSKIRTLDDLAQLGGTFLGFRGEALASIAELSGCVIITTRVDGETVATTLKHDKSGKLIDSFSTSHGTGTTVRVQEFLKSIPVRKQTAQKHTAKTIHEVKKLLFDYAYARPTVRFLLKILKAKSEKDNWSYVPNKDTHKLTDTASKIAGKEIVEMCKEHSATSPCGNYVIRSLLLSKDGVDFSKASGTGQHFSVDGRPMTSDQGLAKCLAKLYKQYIQNAAPEEVKTPARPFIYMRLSCPRGSYDVNIEPAKNVVMFQNQDVITDLFENILREQYGENRTERAVERSKRDMIPKSGLSNFDLLLATKEPRDVVRKEPAEDNVATSTSRMSPTEKAKGPMTDTVRTTPATTRKSYSTMYHLNDDMDDNDEHDALHPITVSGDRQTIDNEEEDVMNPRVTNPFTLAKLNTRLFPIQVGTNDPSNSVAQEVNVSLFTKPSVSSFSNHLSAHLSGGKASTQESHLPSPNRSPENEKPYQNPGPPNRPWRRRAHSSEAEEESSGSEDYSAFTLGQPKLLDAWIEKINTPRPTNLTESSGRETETSNCSYHLSQRIHSIGSPSSSPIPLSRPHQAPFRSPLKDPRNSQLSISPKRQTSKATSATKPSDGISALSLRQFPTLRSSDPSQSISRGVHRFLGDQSDLDNIMDFEVRKRDTILQHRRSQESRLTSGNQRSSGDHNAAIQQFVVPSRPQNEGQEHRERLDYASRFDEDIPPQPSSASYTQNPHWNRYKAATRDLDSAQANRGGSTNLSTNDHQNHVPLIFADSGPSQLSENDPRAHLIRQQRTSAAQDIDIAQKLNKRVKRAKTSHLPFETIPASFATFEVVAEPETVEQGGFPPPMEELARTVRQLSLVDIYVKSGRTDSVQWKDWMSAETAAEVAAWEKRLTALVGECFRQENSDALGGEDGSEAQTAIEITLEKALQEHIKHLEAAKL